MEPRYFQTQIDTLQKDAEIIEKELWRTIKKLQSNEYDSKDDQVRDAAYIGKLAINLIKLREVIGSLHSID